MNAKKGNYPLTLVAIAVASATTFVTLSAQAEDYSSTEETMVVVSSRDRKSTR